MEDRLKKFVAIVDAGSFTAAAELLHTSQPALSNAVQKLERELKAPLLERGSHTLTKAGQLAYEHGKRLQVHAQNLQTQLVALSEEKPTIHIGMIDSVAEILFLKGNELDHIAHETNLVLSVEDSSRLIRAVDAGELALALAVQQDEQSASLQVYKRIGDEAMVLVAKKEDAARVREELTTGSLSRFLSYTTSSTQKIISRNALRQGIELRVLLAATPQVLLGLVRAGRGVSVLPYFMAKPYIKNGELAVIELGGQSVVNRPIVATTRKQRVMAKPVDALISRASSLLHELSVEANEDILAATQW